MNDKRKLGIGSLLVADIQSKSRKGADDFAFEAALDAGKQTLSLEKAKKEFKFRNGSGGRGKAKLSIPLRTITSEVYSEMKAELGGNPPWEAFIEQLKCTHPNEAWVDDTVNGWWKKLNKDIPLL